MTLFVVGINHKTAPIALRERFTFSGGREREFASVLNGKDVIRERAFLSTCNRTEVYGVAEDAGAAYAEVLSALSRLSGLSPSDFEPNVYFKTNAESVSHLFTVASGLDSMALGETEILGQVKDAYLKAHGEGATGAVLNTLFQKSLAVGKKVRTETEIGAGKVSVASIAIDLAGKIFEDLNTKHVLVLGSGEVARSVCEALAPRAPRRFLIANRSADKAEELARAFGGKVVPYGSFDQHMPQTDILIASLAVQAPVVTRDRADAWMKHKRGALFVIDLGLPRNVEPSVGDASDVYLYNIDDLRSIADRNIAARQGAVAACRDIVERAAAAFTARLDERAGRHEHQQHGKGKPS